LEIVTVAGLSLDLSPLPNRTARAFDFRRHQCEYAPSSETIKPKSSSPIIVVGMHPGVRRDLALRRELDHVHKAGAYRGNCAQEF
jgi:hypothetical protein